MKKNLFFFLCLAPATGFCGPDITLLSGTRTELEISRALADKSRWFDRAILNCASQTKRGCDIVIELQLAPQATTPACKVASSDLKPDELGRLYCKVAETLSFSPLPAASAFTLAFNKKTEMISTAPAVGVARLPAGANTKTEPPKPAAEFAAQVLAPANDLTPRTAAISAGHPDFVPVNVSARIPPLEKSTASCAIAVKVRDSESVRQCFDQTGSVLNLAYQRELRKNPQLEGSLKMTLTVEPDGQVSQLTGTVTSGRLSAAFAQQLVDIVAGINFGTASKQVTLNHDLNFAPQ